MAPMARCDVAWGNSGKRLATVGDDGGLRVWDTDSGYLISEVSQVGMLNDKYVDLSFLPALPGAKRTSDSLLVALVSSAGSAALWNVGEGSLRRSDASELDCGILHSVSGHAGSFFAVGAGGKVHEFPTLGPLQPSRSHLVKKGSAPTRIALSSDGATLAVSVGPALYVVDPASLHTIAMAQGHSAPIRSLAVSETGEFIVTADHESPVAVLWHRRGMTLTRYATLDMGAAPRALVISKRGK
ncbi:hypothetical protein KIPB_007495, partial [Kipferlia bialata]|eukprot:g7495.t1